MTSTDPRLDALLSGFSVRKQEETARRIHHALRLEDNRKRGADVLRDVALGPARDVSARLQEAGHRVVHQELLDAYPPCLRIELWPSSRGPEAHPVTFELIWSLPGSDEVLTARRWGLGGGGPIQGSERVEALDELWVKEQLLAFLRDALDRS